jgi:hypothetical protein
VGLIRHLVPHDLAQWSHSVNIARRPAPVLVVLPVTFILAACQGAGSGASVSASLSNAPSMSASESPAATQRSEPTATPTGDLGPFSCDLPVTGTAAVNRAHLIDVRVGTHRGYDRVVFEFEAGVPAFILDQAIPPLVEDASGRELDIDGRAFWQLVMHDASRTDLDGDTSFTDTDFHPDFTKLTELVEGGDFEAVSTWYFGLDAKSCVRVLTLKDPSRLVFDIQH